jgi:hypothetical protein
MNVEYKFRILILISVDVKVGENTGRLHESLDPGDPTDGHAWGSPSTLLEEALRTSAVMPGSAHGLADCCHIVC